MTPMMKCGHSANAATRAADIFDKMIPCCAICLPRDGSLEIAENPDLTGRMAQCHCGAKKESSTDLAFFKHNPQGVDQWYCGCDGWN